MIISHKKSDICTNLHNCKSVTNMHAQVTDVTIAMTHNPIIFTLTSGDGAPLPPEVWVGGVAPWTLFFTCWIAAIVIHFFKTVWN